MRSLSSKFILANLVVYILIHLQGCAATDNNQQNTANPLTVIASLKSDPIKQNDKNKSFKYAALKETALALAAQTGLAWQTNNINRILEKNSKLLENIFNFQGMILKDNVLPPVLIDSDNGANIDPNGQSIRLANKNYLISKQARLVTTAPNWREYLFMQYQYPEKPSKAMLPENKQEKDIWRSAIKQGWQLGIQQANNIFTTNLRKIQQDLEGMILYKTLLIQNIVSAPHVGTTAFGVTGDTNALRLNDQLVKITDLPKLNRDSQKWRPVVSHE